MPSFTVSNTRRITYKAGEPFSSTVRITYSCSINYGQVRITYHAYAPFIRILDREQPGNVDNYTDYRQIREFKIPPGDRR